MTLEPKDARSQTGMGTLAIARFASLWLVGVSLVPALAHLLELPGKTSLPKEDYFVVQQIYRGWALLGVVVIGAFLATLTTAVIARRARAKRDVFSATTACACIAAGQALFWAFTFPANQATANWLRMPDDWIALRTQWEYSHAGNAVLTLIAFSALAWSAATRARSDDA